VCARLGADEVSAAYSAAVVESDTDSEEGRAGATDSNTDVPGQTPCIYAEHTHTSAFTYYPPVPLLLSF